MTDLESKALRNLLMAAEHLAYNYLVDERDEPEFCMDSRHHEAILDLFAAVDFARQAQESSRWLR